jgi:signal transduction histidine kinase
VTSPDRQPGFEPDDISGSFEIELPSDPLGLDLDEAPDGYPADLPYPPRPRSWETPARYGHRPRAIPSERVGEIDAFRQIAHSLAAGTDSSTVLQVLCEAAMDQGRSSGAMVAEVTPEGGRFVACTGIVSDLAGTAFPLAGSVTSRVVETRSAIAVETMRESSPFFESLLGQRGVGPALVVPLIAHEAFLGVLIVTRRVDTPVFDGLDESRLSTVADLASLGLWKARLLEEARDADAAKTAFLATLSHELRTPMAAVEGYSELLEDEILGPLVPAQRDVLTNLRAVSRHLGALIEEILTFASLEADRVVPRLAAVRLDELCDSLHPILAPLAREKGITLRFDVAPGLPHVQTDEDRVRQILLNLSANAIKFTDVGDVLIRVSCGTGSAPDGSAPARDDVPSVYFEVKDTGIGISAADLARLFKPFSQVDDGPARRHKGTGLGLYISRRLAELLGGRIDVLSRPGEGSTFTLVIPVGS